MRTGKDNFLPFSSSSPLLPVGHFGPRCDDVTFLFVVRSSFHLPNHVGIDGEGWVDGWLGEAAQNKMGVGLFVFFFC
jgi:hypothetical protein